jgi:hypothetical protein
MERRGRDLVLTEGGGIPCRPDGQSHTEAESDPTLGESWEDIQLSPSGFEFPANFGKGASPGAYIELKCSGSPASFPGVYDSISPAKSALGDLFENLCSIDKSGAVRKDLLEMEDSPPPLDLDLFNWSSSNTSSPGGAKGEKMSDGQVRLGPSKFPKVAYKTPVTLDSSDEDWVWCGDPKGNASQREPPAAGPQAEKGLSPVGSEDARSFARTLSEQAIGFEGARVVKAICRPGEKVPGEMIYGKPGTLNSGFQRTGCPLGPQSCVSLLPDSSGGELVRQANLSPVNRTTGNKGTQPSQDNEGPVARDLLFHATGYKLDPGTVILTQPGVLDHKAKRAGCEQDDRATTGSCAVTNEPGPCFAQPDRVVGQNLNDPVYIHASPVMGKNHPVTGISGQEGISNDNTGFGTPCNSSKGNLRDFGSDRVATHFPKTPQKMPTPP